MLPESWHESEAHRGDARSTTDIFVGRTIQLCPTLLIVVHDVRPRSTPLRAAEDLMSLGCVMQNMWLMTEGLGISMQVLSSLGESIDENRVRTLLDIPQHLQIAFAVRLGYPISDSESYLRMRCKIQDFTHRNRYGARACQTRGGPG